MSPERSNSWQARPSLAASATSDGENDDIELGAKAETEEVVQRRADRNSLFRRLGTPSAFDHFTSGIKTPMAKTSSATRAPRGTKILAKAFFAAADEIPEPQRAEVVKAALAAIRDELKTAREKVAVAKAKAKGKAGKAAAPVRRPAGVTKARKKAAPARPKTSARGARKAAASQPTEQTVPDQSARTTVSSDVDDSI
jgi:hypothetical protein